MQKETVVRCPKASFDVDRSVGRDLWTEFGCVAPDHHTFDEVCSPRYFGTFRSTRMDSPRNSDNGLRVRDRINVVAKDGSWMATLLVRDIPAGIDEVHTRVLEHMSFAAGDLPEGYKIENRGNRGHVIYLNGAEIESGFADPELAEKRISFLTRERNIEARVEAASAKGKGPAKKKAPAADVPAEPATASAE